MKNEHVLYHEDEDVIFEEGSTGNQFYIIESGKVEISQCINGQKIAIAVLVKGDFFGEMSAIIDAPRSATATAIGKTKLICLSADSVFQRIQASSQFTVNLLQTLARRLRSTTSTMRMLMVRLHTIDAGFVEIVSPGGCGQKAEEMMEYLKQQIELKDKQIERQQTIIMELSKNIDKE